MKKVLITGINSHIGSCVARRLTEQGFEVEGLIRSENNLYRLADIKEKITLHNVNILDKKSLNTLVPKINPDIVYHFASYGGYPLQSEKKKIFQTNIVGTLNLLNSLLKTNIDLFVNTGTVTEYGSFDIPTKEDFILNPKNDYGTSKACQTMLVNHFLKEHGLPALSFRLSSVYGPHMMNTKIIPIIIDKCNKKEDIKMSNPNIVRDYVYIDDVVDAYMLHDTLKKNIGEIFNLSSGVGISMEKLIYTVFAALKKETKYQWNAIERKGDVFYQVADCSKSRDLLQWKAQVSLTNGLEKYIIWKETEENALSKL